MARRRILIAVLTVMSLVGVACEYDPSLAGTPETSGCDGVAGTLGFGFNDQSDPPGGSSYVGTEGDDVIVIVGGPVTVDALGGDDLICVTDAIESAPGAQIVIDGGAGNDTIVGSPTTYETCSAETTSNCDAGSVPGSQLCGLVLSEDSTQSFTLNEDTICAGVGVMLDPQTPLGIDFTLDLNGHSFISESSGGYSVRSRFNAETALVNISNGALADVAVRGSTSLTNVVATGVSVAVGDLLVTNTTVNGRIWADTSGSVRVESSTIEAAYGAFDQPQVVLVETDVVMPPGGSFSTGLTGSIDMTGGSVSGGIRGYDSGDPLGGAVAQFSDVEFFDNVVAIAANAWGTPMVIADSLIRNNESGIEAWTFHPEGVLIRDTVVRDNLEHGLKFSAGTKVTIEGSWVRGNGFGVPGVLEPGIVALNPASFLLTDSIIDENAGRGIRFVSASGDSSVYTVTNTLIGNNGLPDCGAFPCYP